MADENLYDDQEEEIEVEEEIDLKEEKLLSRVTKVADVMQEQSPDDPDYCERLTVRFSALHQTCTDQPTAHPAPFSHFLTTREVQTWHRRVKVNETGCYLELAPWMQGEDVAGMVLLQNISKLNPKVNPTLEEREMLKRANLVVLNADKNAKIGIVRPGRFMFWEPEGIHDKIYLRSAEGVLNIHLTVYPK